MASLRETGSLAPVHAKAQSHKETALLFAAGAGLFTTWSGWRGYMRVTELISRLQMNAEPAEPQQIARVEETAQQYGFEVGLVMSDYPFSFVWGFTRSKLIVSTGLLRTLNESSFTLWQKANRNHARSS